MTKAKETDFAELAKRVLLQSYAPASVITNLQGNILYVHGETGRYLRPAPGQATLNVVEMAHEELQLELRAAVHHAVSHATPTLRRTLSVKADGDIQALSFSVRRLRDPDAGEGLLLVSFQEVVGAAPGKPARRKRVAGSAARHIEELERDL